MPPDEKKSAPAPKGRALVKVKNLGPNPISEDGQYAEKGGSLEVTTERRKALGDLVADES